MRKPYSPSHMTCGVCTFFKCMNDANQICSAIIEGRKKEGVSKASRWIACLSFFEGILLTWTLQRSSLQRQLISLVSSNNQFTHRCYYLVHRHTYTHMFTAAEEAHVEASRRTSDAQAAGDNV